MNMVCVFTIMNSFRERMINGHLKCEASLTVNCKDKEPCPIIKFMDYFHAYKFQNTTLLLLFNALIPLDTTVTYQEFV